MSLSSKRKRKALALLSGGLDSTLAAKLIMDQGILVEGIGFITPFSHCLEGKSCAAAKVASRLGLRLRIVDVGEKYFRLVENPLHGYGKHLNPCIDCRIFQLSKAKEYAAEIHADFIITGEVLDQRPMSQHLKALTLIERETCLEGRILRPLSARLLPETDAEQKGWVDGKSLLDIHGRSRRRQMELAKSLGVTDYPSPAGGCLLTDPIFSARLKDLIESEKTLNPRSVSLLRIGRHFRLGQNKIVVGRNEEENRRLMELKNPRDYFFEVSDYASPTTLLLGPESEEAIRIAASITARYSDAPGDKVLVKFGRQSLDRSFIVFPLQDEDIAKMRVG